MLQKFLQHIKDHHLFKPEEKILLAVSGGIDSVAMADLFHQANLSFGIAHCNFGLRGEVSDKDELFVRKIAKKYKVPFHVNHFDTRGYAEQEKISVQMAARHLRYQWFNQLLTAEKYAYLATAHHQNDVLETILLNITKGTGIAGLHGIRVKTGTTIRPVLFADKSMIMDYVADNQLTWREDSSNESIKYQRNLIRHEVIPRLQEINPDILHTIRTTVERMEATENIFREQVAAFSSRVVEEKGDDTYIHISGLRDSKEPALYLHEMIRSQNFNYVQAKTIAERMTQGAGKIFESATHRLNIDRDHLIISPKDLTGFQDVLIGDDLESLQQGHMRLLFQKKERKGFVIPTEKHVAALDLEKLEFPLKLRKWKEGDWFCPLGMNKKKKLSDYMIDEKIPLNLKERVFVVSSGKSIVWVMGYRVDDRFKVTDNTKTVYTITYVTGDV